MKGRKDTLISWSKKLPDVKHQNAKKHGDGAKYPQLAKSNLNPIYWSTLIHGYISLLCC